MENIKDYKTNIKEIVFSDEEEKCFCDIFVYEPENIEEKSLGNLYIIGEVVNLPENSSYIVNLLASIIKKEFYSNKKRTTLESLEASLNKANSTLSDLTEQGNVAWIGNLNMTCAAHRQKELHLSQTGKIKTLLIRNGQIKDIGKNVIADEKPHPFRTFANIASGELELNDLVLFATPGLFNILSTEKIRQMSSSENFEEFSNEIQETIKKESDISTIAALLINVESKKEESRIPQIKIVPEEISQKNEIESTRPAMIHKEEAQIETEISAIKNGPEQSDFLEKSEKISLENIIKEFEEKERTSRKTGKKETMNENEPIPSSSLINESEKNSDIFIPSQNIEAVIPKTTSETSGSHPKDGKPSLKIFFAIAGKIFEKTKSVIPILKAQTSKLASGFKIKKPQIDLTQKLRLMQSSKIIFSTLALIFIVLLGNMVITNYNNQIEAEKQKYSDLLEKSQAKIDEAEQVLIYNDSDKARQSLLEAKVIATEVRDGYKNLSAEANALLEKIQPQIDKIDKIFRIDNPSIAADLSKNEKVSNISTLTKFEGNYYTINQDNSIYKLDLASGTANEIQLSEKNTENAGKAKLATAIAKTGEIVFITENNKVMTFNPEKSELQSRSIKLNQDLSNITGVASYNSFIYLLEPGANQIYKHKETVDGFGEGAKWINEKSGIDIRNATSMTIDSTIYILRSNGSVEEYLTGNKIKFSIEELKDPAMEPTLIFTETGLKNLYIADPLKNRVIVFDKEKGTLLKQFIVKNFNFSIKDMTVDDKEQTLFILSDKTIFKLDLTSGIK